MQTSTHFIPQLSNPHPRPYADGHSEVARLYRLFPPLRGTIAGIVDEIGYLSLGLFTTPVARNLVVIATFVMRGCPPNMALILAVPGFMIPVAAVWFIAKAHDRRGPSLIRPLLVVHFPPLAF